MELLRSRSWSASSPLGLRQGPTGAEWERGSCTSGLAAARRPCQVAGEPEPRSRGGQSGPRGRGQTPRPRARPEHVAGSPRTFPKVNLSVPRPPAAGPRVSPRKGPGSRRLRPRGRWGRRRGLPAFQELAEPALHLLLRGTCGHRARQPPPPPRLGSHCADPPPGGPARPPPRAPVRRCATSLLGPLVMVYMVRRGRPPARSPGRTPCPALRPGSHSAGAQGAAPLTGGRARRAGGGPLHAPGP